MDRLDTCAPLVMDFGYDLTGSYTAPLMVNAVSNLVAAMLMRLWGPYPDLINAPWPIG